MFEKEKNHIAITALIVLLVAGFAAAVRPGMVIVKETGEIYSYYLTKNEQNKLIS